MAVADQQFLNLRKSISKSIGKSGWPLYLHGPPGHGKTCFAALIYASVGGYGETGSMWYGCRKVLGQLAVSRVNSDSFVEEFCRDGSFQQVDYWTAWNRIRSIGLAVFDDLGATPLTEVQSGIMCEILDARVGLSTIITGNLDKAAMSKVADARLVSRIFAGTSVLFKTGDQRARSGVRIGGAE